MNTHNQFTSYYQQSFNLANNRDKTTSFLQPTYYGSYHTQQNLPINQNSHVSNNNFVPLIPSSSNNFSHSDKYKNFYTEDYRTVHDVNSARNKNDTMNRMLSRTGFTDQPVVNRSNIMNYNSSIPSQQIQQKSQDRKRFFTVTSRSRQRQNRNLGVTSPSIRQTAPESQSSTNFNKSYLQNQYSSKSFITSNRQQQESNKNLNKLMNQRFSNSNAENIFSKQQRQGGNTSQYLQNIPQNSQKKSQYLEKANKKISLKRDISPKYYQMQRDNKPKNYELQKQRSPRYQQLEKQSHSVRMNTTYENLFNDDLSQRAKSQLLQGRHNDMDYRMIGNQQSQKSLLEPQFYQRNNFNNDGIEDIIRQRREDFFKKNLNKKAKSPQLQSKPTTPSNQLEEKQMNKSRVNNVTVDKQELSYTRKTTRNSHVNDDHTIINTNTKKTNINCNKTDGSIKKTNGSIKNQSQVNPSPVTPSNNSKDISPLNNKTFSPVSQSKPTINKPATFQMIDSQVYTDMKISRIEQSTINLQEKLGAIMKNMETLSKTNKQQQSVINYLNQYISRQEEEGVSAHDVKRIKKELKIIKTNFQTAFTSMTEQINRKLVKEEQIMKNLSDEIKMVAEQNVKLSESIGEKSMKVSSLEKSVASFMRENEERMESLVLNDSFSSAKKSRNHSFEYGLDLRNISGEQVNTSKQKEVIQGLGKKVDNIEREIRKMKVFHIEEKETQQQKLLHLGNEIQKIKQQLQTKLSKSQVEQNLRQIIPEIITLDIQNFRQQTVHLMESQESKLMIELTEVRSQLQQLQKNFHDQLYDYRLSKLQDLPNKQHSNQGILISERQVGDKIIELQGKNRGINDRLGAVEKKLSTIEERQYQGGKNYDEQKIKELKHSGDIRQLQNNLKEITQQLNQLTNYKNNQQSNTELQNKQIKNILNTLQNRLMEIERLNLIHTENILSINTEFERVINKEIIPKFTQINSNINQIDTKINHKLQEFNINKLPEHNINKLPEINKLQEINKPQQSKLTPNQHTFITQLIQTELQTKLQHYLTQNLPKIIQNKVKLLSTKLISSKCPLSKIGLYKNKNPNLNTLDSPILFNSSTLNEPSKQETYLIDEDGWLMDWEGFYLMELDEYGNRRRIKVTEEEIYFMEVNGLEVKRVTDK